LALFSQKLPTGKKPYVYRKFLNINKLQRMIPRHKLQENMMMKKNERMAHFSISGEEGFSFLELMVVVVILGILATYIAPRFMGRTDDAKAVKAKVDILSIETALKLYKLDNGHYPTTEQGIAALVEKPSTEPVPLNWKEKGYLEKARVPKDPWGKDYLYLSPGIHDDYDLISYGADGVPGGEGKNKDVNSWDLD
jgi:general secretion pathway protein G